MSSFLRANRPAGAKNLRKNIKIEPPGGPTSTQERPKSIGEAKFSEFWATKEIKSGPRVSKSAGLLPRGGGPHLRAAGGGDAGDGGAPRRAAERHAGAARDRATA